MLTNLGQFEILDRTSCILSQLEDFIVNHPEITKKQKKKVDKAIKHLADVYQLAGKEVWNEE